ncbi:putative motility protein [uncultured Tepidimonas sp.]|jgi:hypothetical protein|uniref:putative motility protein n=1 Tax=Tepidimonas sp. HKU77 TaxID=3414503 RepID=UPI002604CAE1|nr:putative motility protein [uncultured Tepidimonas sp.]
MNIGSTTLIGQVATQGVEAGDAAQILALRKALQLQQQQAQAMLQAVPQPPRAELPLATEGPLGTRLNVLA